MAHKYDHEYKVRAVKLTKEIGPYMAESSQSWQPEYRTPASAMSLSEEITILRKRVTRSRIKKCAD